MYGMQVLSFKSEFIPFFVCLPALGTGRKFFAHCTGGMLSRLQPVAFCTAFGTGWMLSRAFHWLHVFPRPFHVLHVFPCLPLVACLPAVACFPALCTGCVCSRAWPRLNVLPLLEPYYFPMFYPFQRLAPVFSLFLHVSLNNVKAFHLTG